MFARVGNNTQRIWKLLAYVGRYGHQPVNVAWSLTTRNLSMLADCVAELVQDENAAGNMPRED